MRWVRTTASITVHRGWTLYSGRVLKSLSRLSILDMMFCGWLLSGVCRFYGLFPHKLRCGECPRNCPENNGPERGKAFRIPCQLPSRNPTFRADQSLQSLELELSHQSLSKQLTSLATRPSSATIIRFSQQTPRFPHVQSSKTTKPVSFQYISLVKQSSMHRPPTK